MTDHNFYKTSDFQLASFLVAVGIKLSEINFINSKKAEFLFETPDYIDDLIRQFWNDEPSVGPRTLLTAQKSLKQRLYENEYQNRAK